MSLGTRLPHLTVVLVDKVGNPFHCVGGAKPDVELQASTAFSVFVCHGGFCCCCCCSCFCHVWAGHLPAGEYCVIVVAAAAVALVICAFACRVGRKPVIELQASLDGRFYTPGTVAFIPRARLLLYPGHGCFCCRCCCE